MTIGQGGSNPGDGNSTPFGDGNGGAGQGADTGKSPDFTQSVSGGQTGGGGRDFTKENRSQTADAVTEVTPNPQSVPTSGKLPLASPGAVSANVAGSTAPKTPYKGLR